ncbi:uncharacterized protein LOC100895108 [Callithrix jacchus]
MPQAAHCQRQPKQPRTCPAPRNRRPLSAPRWPHRGPAPPHPGAPPTPSSASALPQSAPAHSQAPPPHRRPAPPSPPPLSSAHSPPLRSVPGLTQQSGIGEDPAGFRRLGNWTDTNSTNSAPGCCAKRRDAPALRLPLPPGRCRPGVVSCLDRKQKNGEGLHPNSAFALVGLWLHSTGCFPGDLWLCKNRQSAILGCGAVLQQPSWAGFLPAVSGSKERLAFPSRYIWYLGWCYGIEILLLWKSHACRFNRRCQFLMVAKVGVRMLMAYNE